MDNHTLPWVEKYRPENMDNLISHKNIVDTLSNFIKDKCMPHLLFYGPPGIGKTSTILACANNIFGQNKSILVLHLNASDERGIETARQRIKDFACSKSIISNYPFKLVILDEADSMTEDAQLALRQIIVNYTYNTRFCLICNFINKIIPNLQSRFTKFRFSVIKYRDISDRINEICNIENINITDNAKHVIHDISNGDFRKYINILQSLSSKQQSINENDVYDYMCELNKTQLHTIISSLFNDEFVTSYNNIKYIMENNSITLDSIIKRVSKYLINNKLYIDLNKSLFTDLANIEHNLGLSNYDDIQLKYFISAFINARVQLTE